MARVPTWLIVIVLSPFRVCLNPQSLKVLRVALCCSCSKIFTLSSKFSPSCNLLCAPRGMVWGDLSSPSWCSLLRAYNDRAALSGQYTLCRSSCKRSDEWVIPELMQQPAQTCCTNYRTNNIFMNRCMQDLWRNEAFCSSDVKLAMESSRDSASGA